MHSRKTFLFNGSKAFAKREGNESFGIAMECFDNTKVYELGGTCILLRQLNSVGN